MHKHLSLVVFLLKQSIIILFANAENSKQEFNIIYSSDFRITELPTFITEAANATTDKTARNSLLRGTNILIENGNNGIGRTTGIWLGQKSATIYLISEGGRDYVNNPITTFFFGPSTIQELLDVDDLSSSNTTPEQFLDFYLRVIQAKWDLLHP